MTALIRASCKINGELSKTRPAWKELEYAARTKAQSASMRHPCRRQAGCAAWTEGSSRATGCEDRRNRRGLRVSLTFSRSEARMGESLNRYRSYRFAVPRSQIAVS